MLVAFPKHKFCVIFHYFSLFYSFYPLFRTPIPHQRVHFYVIYIYAYTSTIPWPIQYPETTPIPELSENGLILMADLINWLHCHTTSSLQGLWKGRVSLLIHNIFLEDLKSQILAQNSEWEGRNKAHKHSGGIESNFSKKEKVHNSGREGGDPDNEQRGGWQCNSHQRRGCDDVLL